MEMVPIEINMMAIVITVVATFVFGFIWYTPLFGKAWAHEMGMDPNEKPDTGLMIKGMVAMLVGNFFMAFVFANNMAVWDPATWGVADKYLAMSPLMSSVNAAFFTWLGFYLPVDLSNVFWEKKSWKLFGINTSYHLLMLFIAALILIMM